MSNQRMAEVWHWVAMGIATGLFVWEVSGVFGHYWLRRRET